MGKMEVDKGDELVMDQSAYEMYHQAQTNSPCLSFDILKDDLGSNRNQYPHTCFIVSGTQAETALANNVIVMKMSNLKRTFKEAKDNDDEDSESDDDDDEEDEENQPELEAALIKHTGGVNRIRATDIDNKKFCATWSELGKVYIWELTAALNAVSDQRAMSEFVRKDNHMPTFQFNGHQSEGFALDWSPIVAGQMATGDCTKNIHLWKILENTGQWNVDQKPFSGHTGSVEDIQWSPTEATVFASCSTDKSIRIWDIRATPAKANMMTCEVTHTSDVNVINWNRNEPFLASGGDDGYIKIWDLRLFQQNKPVGILKYHSKPITSIEWNKNDSTVFAATSEDDQLTIWDLAIEKDDDALITDNNNNNDDEKEDEENKPFITDQMLKDLPPQLLFIHQGQKEMKELHWHAQIPGMIISTAHSCFNVFKTISV